MMRIEGSVPAVSGEVAACVLLPYGLLAVQVADRDDIAAADLQGKIGTHQVGVVLYQHGSAGQGFVPVPYTVYRQFIYNG